MPRTRCLVVGHPMRAYLSPVSRHVHSVSRKAAFSPVAPASWSLRCITGLTSSIKTSHSLYCHQSYTAYDTHCVIENTRTAADAWTGYTEMMPGSQQVAVTAA